MLLSFPKPIVAFDFNFGFEGVIDESASTVQYLSIIDNSLADFKLDHDITIIAVNEPTFVVEPDRVAIFTRFKPWYTKALQLASAESGTIGVDTATELDDLVQSATLEEVRVHKYKGKTDPEDFQPVAFDYGKRNDIMARIYTAPLQVRDLNACFTHKSKAEYAGKEATGRQVMAGWSGAGGQVQVMLKQYKEAGEFRGLIELCRINPVLEGTVIDDPNYAELMDWLS